MTDGWSVDAVAAAVRSGWGRDNCAQPDDWTPERPSQTQCDASSFVAWEMLGGDLVLGRVTVDGVRTQHRCRNRLDGLDVDLTADQFGDHEVATETAVVTTAEISERRSGTRDELADRIGRLRGRTLRALAPDGS